MLKIDGFIPITIQPLFWIVAALIGWLNTGSIEGTAIWAMVIFVSILVHEFGHALTAVAFGQKAEIELMGLGGLTKRNGQPIEKWKEFLIVLNGPIAGFLLAGLVWWMERKFIKSDSESPFAYGLLVAFYVNVFWTIVNLFPILPMDGGKLMSIILQGIFGVRGAKISHLISLVLASGLGLLFFVTGAYLAGSLFLMFAYESYQSWTFTRPLQQHDTDLSIVKLISDVEQYMIHRPGSITEEKNDVWARTAMEDVRAKTGKGLLYVKATELLATLLSDEGKTIEAYEMLKAEFKHLNGRALTTLLYFAFTLERWQDILDYGDKVYREDPKYYNAIANAAANAKTGRIKPCIGWIKCAIKDGLPDVKATLNADFFKDISKDPNFREFVESIKEPS